MNSEAEAAELILRIVFGGTAYFLKAMPSMVVGGIEGCKAFGGMIQNAVNKHRTKGSSKLEYIIRQEKGMSVFTLPEKEMDLFKEAASKIKKHPYVALDSVEKTDAPDRMITIICTGDDAPLFNAIIKQNRLHGNMAADFEHQRTEKVAEKPEPAKEPVSKEAVEQAEQQKAAQEDTAKKNEEFINAVEGKGRGEKETENPTPAAEETMENAPLSENASQSFRGSIDSKEEVDIEHLHSEVQKDVDIEHLPSAIEIEGKQPEADPKEDTFALRKDDPHARPSVRQHLKEVTEELEKQQADPNSEVNRSQTINIIMQKLQEHSSADVPAK